MLCNEICRFFKAVNDFFKLFENLNCYTFNFRSVLPTSGKLPFSPSDVHPFGGAIVGDETEGSVRARKGESDQRRIEHTDHRSVEGPEQSGQQKGL